MRNKIDRALRIIFLPLYIFISFFGYLGVGVYGGGCNWLKNTKKLWKKVYYEK